MLLISEYSVHPKLLLSVRTRRSAYREYFDNEYRSVSQTSTDSDATRISVNIVERLPEPQAGDRIRHLTFKRLFRHHFLIRGFGTTHVDIYFRDSLWGRLYAKTITLFLQAQVVEPVVYDALLRREVYFMHAAGVSDGSQGYVFAAHGGTGKTTLTMGLMGEGLEVLGDDLLMLEPREGTVRPYLRPLHIFTYNVKTLRNARIPWFFRAKVRSKDILRAILEFTTRQEFLISTRIHAATLYPNFRVGSVVPVRRVLFLVRVGEDSTVTMSHDTVDTVAKQILESADLNKSLYVNVLHPNEVAPYQNLEMALIKKVLALVPQVDFVNTRTRDFAKLGDFARWLVGP